MTNLAMYEEWQALEEANLRHSQLYSLPPMGVGTAQVENLTSYVTRLATAHSVSVSKLMLQEISPLFRKPRTKSSLFGFSSSSLLRGNTLGSEFVWVLQRLTARLDLPYLNLLPWSQVMNSQEVVRPHRAWCSGCLEEQRLKGETIYEFLWWAFQLVRICPHHSQSLQTSCPYCQQTQPWLGQRSHAGYCSACQSWLGIVPNPDKLTLPVMTDLELTWQHWLVKAIGELLAAGPQLRHLPLGEQLVTGLSNCCSQIAGGNITHFIQLLKAHHLDITASYLHKWLTGGGRPSWQQLLEFCFCLQITPLALLTNQLALRFPFILQPLTFLSLPASSSPVKVALIQDQLKQSLLTIIASNETPAPSLSAVSQRLNMAGTSSLKRYFPEECAIIVERYRLYRQTRKEERLCLLREKTRQATFAVHAQGLYPSMVRVDEQLGEHGGI